MHEVLVNRLGGLSLPRKSVVRLIDRPDMTLDVYRGRKTTMQQLSSRAQCDLDIQASDKTLVLVSSSCRNDNLCQNTLKSHHAGLSYGSDTSVGHYSVCTKYTCPV